MEKHQNDTFSEKRVFIQIEEIGENVLCCTGTKEEGGLLFGFTGYGKRELMEKAISAAGGRIGVVVNSQDSIEFGMNGKLQVLNSRKM